MGFQDKIDTLQVCAELRGGWGGDTVIELQQLSMELQTMRQDIANYRQILATAKKDIQMAHDLQEQIKQMSLRLVHMKTNLPIHLPHADAPACGATAVPSNLTTKKNTSKDVPPNIQGKVSAKAGSGKERHVPVIDYATVDEFESVPKYIRGRLQYDQVNNAVDELNKALECKYSLMSRPRSKISEVDWRIITTCKRQEIPETKGVYFVVDDDIKRWSGLKLDTAGRSTITVLRTLKRIREIRGPGSLVRFAVLTYM